MFVEGGSPTVRPKTADAPPGPRAFLLDLHGRLRDLTDPAEILHASCRMLGEHLGAGRVHYVEFHDDACRFKIEHAWRTADMPALVGQGDTAAFGREFFAALEAGQAVVIEDVRSDRLTAHVAAGFADVRTFAAISAPLVRKGVLLGALSVGQAAPRAWTRDEVALVEEVGDRTWSAFEHARAAAALRASESRYRSLFESIDEGFCVIRMLFDDSGIPNDYAFLEVNPAFVRHTGLEDAVGRTVRSFAPDHEQHWFDIYGRVATTGEAIRFEQPARAIGDRWYDVYAFRIGEPDERKVAVLFRDRTEQRRMLLGLEEADRRKDEFLAMLAHELRNPLAPLRNALKVLDREPIGARGQRALGIGHRQLRHLTRLVDDLLEVSRVTRGLIELRPEAVMVQHVVYGVVDGLASTLEERTLRIELEMPARPVQLRADPVRLAQIVENLLTNASKYTDAGGAITVRVTDADDAVGIEVRDTGIGIDPEHLPVIFELFTQVNTSMDRSRGGLGIGLALVRRLVELHGGTVRCASDGVGRGSSFVVRLPRGERADGVSPG